MSSSSCSGFSIFSSLVQHVVFSVYLVIAIIIVQRSVIIDRSSRPYWSMIIDMRTNHQLSGWG
jgi:hypothetical protein